jgi:hypothetical protein
MVDILKHTAEPISKFVGVAISNEGIAQGLLLLQEREQCRLLSGSILNSPGNG